MAGAKETGKCPSCGATLYNDVPKCPYCGAEIVGESALPPGEKDKALRALVREETRTALNEWETEREERRKKAIPVASVPVPTPQKEERAFP